MATAKVEKAYKLAKERYAELGVDADMALARLRKVSVSVHCWQGDDVSGFESPDSELTGGGIQVTGSYPGKARNPAELRADLEKVFELSPGHHRVNLHAIYGEFGGKRVDRNRVSPEHFAGWVAWAKKQKLKLDFNGSFFSHPKANGGFTLSSKDKSIREFWVEHAKRSREISAYMGRELADCCIHNLWIPDGCKEVPVDRMGYRAILRESLDRIFKVKYNSKHLGDALESKLFGIGSESFVVGSHDFYLSYIAKTPLMICLDMGHFHPTESIADKLSSILQFSDRILIHVSRGIRWDSDHVAILNDEVKALTEEMVRCNALDRVCLSLDFFDGSLNRVGAWVTGMRATLKGILIGLLEPYALLKEAEEAGNNFKRLALLDECRALPFGAVWDYHCEKSGVPVGSEWIDDVLAYEKKVQSKRQ